MFLDDLTGLLTEKIPKLANTVIKRNFNINTGDVSNADKVIFNNTMQALSLNKHVTKPMYQKSNILDFIFTEEKSDIQVANCKTNTYISDHCMVIMDTSLKNKQDKINCNNQGLI